MRQAGEEGEVRGEKRKRRNRGRMRKRKREEGIVEDGREEVEEEGKNSTKKA